jgi:hypothetical protein
MADENILSAVGGAANALMRIVRAVPWAGEWIFKKYEAGRVEQGLNSVLLKRLERELLNLPEGSGSVALRSLAWKDANIRSVLERARVLLEEATAEPSPEVASAVPGGAGKPHGDSPDLSPDWMSRFLDSCQHVSEEDMQTMWARVLAREATRPGTFSLRTVDLIRGLSRAEAQRITQLFGFAVTVEHGLQFIPAVVGAEPPLKLLSACAELGIVGGRQLWGMSSGTAQVAHGGRNLMMIGPVAIPCRRLTSVGSELLTIAGAKPERGILDALRTYVQTTEGLRMANEFLKTKFQESDSKRERRAKRSWPTSMRANVTYNTPEGAREQSKANLLVASSLLDLVVHKTWPLGRFGEGTLLRDFEVLGGVDVESADRAGHAISMSVLPAPRSRWPMVMIASCVRNGDMTTIKLIPFDDEMPIRSKVAPGI